eukprot:1573230-Rhodomonas_salina.1
MEKSEERLGVAGGDGVRGRGEGKRRNHKPNFSPLFGSGMVCEKSGRPPASAVCGRAARAAFFLARISASFPPSDMMRRRGGRWGVRETQRAVWGGMRLV